MKIEINTDFPKWVDILCITLFSIIASIIVVVVIGALVGAGFGFSTLYMLKTTPQIEKIQNVDLTDLSGEK